MLCSSATLKCGNVLTPVRSVPVSRDWFTYVFVPEDTLATVFSNLSVPFPVALRPDVTALSTVLSQNDTFPSTLNAITISLGGKSIFASDSKGAEFTQTGQ